MRKDELDAIFECDTGPIEPHIRALADERALPALAVALCAARIEEAAPAFMDVLAKAAGGAGLSESEDRLFFRGLHLLGAGRRAEAFAPLMQLLRRPDDELEALLGDAITETMPKIVAGVFDGASASLFAAIEEADRDEFLRSVLLGAATFLTWDGRIDQAEMSRFLERFHERRAAPPGDFAWAAWAEAIALLGVRALVDRVRLAFQQGLVADQFMSMSDFDGALAETERARADPGRFQRAHLGYIEDVLVALERFHEGSGDEAFDADWTAEGPLMNPWRSVGRNDPCPCGSGRKFKNCCLG